jgi:BatD DUF11 like domain
MQRVKLILVCLLFPFTINAQLTFKTIVTQKLVTVGESFQVQYVLEDIKKDVEFSLPIFKEFRVVSGPYTYSGLVNSINTSNSVKNIVFTLVATKPGRHIIPGAAVKVNDKLLKSGNVIIKVISQKDAFENSAKQERDEDISEYFLRPGEDPYIKMKRNLFMKVLVDKTSCYVGQPVVATFKLYSRVESKSDIVKNPGFYGFTVYDIINLSDNISTTETVGGRPFDVHTIRSVQLYPLQAGIFTIDAMEVMNKCEFSKSAVNKKTEQEIVEGVFEENKRSLLKTNTVIYENNISTEKITINVKPYPVEKKPVAFNGATGNFFIRAVVEKNKLAKNEEGALIITIDGKGNFTQLSVPAVQWPEGLETFDAVIKDSLDKRLAPLKGSRTFRFPFVANKAGSYSIPAISFTFFDPDSNRYKTLSASPPGITISNEEIKKLPKNEFPEINKRALMPADKNENNSIWLYGGIFLVVLLIILLQLRKTKKEDIVKEQVPAETKSPVLIEELLQPAQFSLVANDGRFYSLLQKSIWDHLGMKLKLSGSKMNKDDLYKAMKEKKMEEQYSNILAILQECNAAVFTKAEFIHDKQELLDRAKYLLEQIKS